MKNDKKKLSRKNEKSDFVASLAESVRKAKRRNADNDDLGPWEDLPVGHVPEVNGPWAIEMPEFLATSGELLVLAEHWAGVAIERTFVECANATNTDDWRRIYFGWRREESVRSSVTSSIA